MHLAGKERRRLVDEINITPLTDVFLVLLIIMMVVAPMMKSMQKTINPPVIEDAQKVDHIPTLLEITQDGKYYVDGIAVEEPMLEAKLKDVVEKGDNQEKKIVVRADKDTKEMSIIPSYDAIQNAGFKNMTIAVDTIPPERLEELKKKNESPPSSTEGAPTS